MPRAVKRAEGAELPSTPGRLGNNESQAINGPCWLYGKWLFSLAMA